MESAREGGDLTNLWTSFLVAPPLLFWVTGIVALVHAYDHGDVVGQVHTFLTSANGTAPLALTILALVVVALSGAVVRPLALPILRLLEGYYWPRPLRGIRKALIARQMNRLERLYGEWKVLVERGLDSLAPDELTQYAILDDRVRRMPFDEGLVMPTRLGNVLRSAEAQPLLKYGLNSIVCWPRLWLLLPADVKGEVSKVRSALDNAALVIFWAVISLVWGFWYWPLFLPGPILALGAWFWLRSKANEYADLFEAVYDVHRGLLYDALGFAMPQDQPDEERRLGRRITTRLWRGEDDQIGQRAVKSV